MSVRRSASVDHLITLSVKDTIACVTHFAHTSWFSYLVFPSTISSRRFFCLLVVANGQIPCSPAPPSRLCIAFHVAHLWWRGRSYFFSNILNRCHLVSVLALFCCFFVLILRRRRVCVCVCDLASQELGRNTSWQGTQGGSFSCEGGPAVAFCARRPLLASAFAFGREASSCLKVHGLSSFSSFSSFSIFASLVASR